MTDTAGGATRNGNLPFNNRMMILAKVLGGLVLAALLAAGLTECRWPAATAATTNETTATALTAFAGMIGAIGIGTIILLGSFAVGAMLGFLFAVPRVSAVEGGSGTDGSNAVAVSANRPLLRTNANLERISDWLTTMLVGVGLSQLTNINDGLLRFRLTIASQVCVPGAACTLPLIAPLLLLFGLVGGFLFMYLYTRVELIAQFVDAERRTLSNAVSAQVKDVAREVRSEGTATFVVEQVAAEERQMSESEAISLMFTLLYQPGQYDRVIRIGAALATTGAAKRPDYWFYLAAAFGQRMHAAKRDKNENARLLARADALDAARRAVQIDPTYRARLWSISDENGPDDDLALLRGDRDFDALTGRG